MPKKTDPTLHVVGRDKVKGNGISKNSSRSECKIDDQRGKRKRTPLVRRSPLAKMQQQQHTAFYMYVQKLPLA